MTCPGCNGTVRPVKQDPTLGVCERCNGLIGDGMTLQDAYEAVNGYMHPDPNSVKNPRYYDLTYHGSHGLERRHGWYDPETHLIVQVG